MNICSEKVSPFVRELHRSVVGTLSLTETCFASGVFDILALGACSLLTVPGFGLSRYLS
jgi:hypothetical protein